MSTCSCRPIEPGSTAFVHLCPEGDALLGRLLDAVVHNRPDVDQRRTDYLTHVQAAADAAREGASHAA